MKKILILLMIGVFIIALFSGCVSNKPISQECLDYFKSLENQKYWSRQSVEAKVEDSSGTSVVYDKIVHDESKKEWYLF